MSEMFQTRQTRPMVRSSPTAEPSLRTSRPGATTHRRRQTKPMVQPKSGRVVRPLRDRPPRAHRTGPALRLPKLPLPPMGRPSRPGAAAPIVAPYCPDALRADDCRNRPAFRLADRPIADRRADDRRHARSAGRAVPVDVAADGCRADRRPLAPRPRPRPDCLRPSPSIRRESSRGVADGRPTDRVANRLRCGVCPKCRRPTRCPPGPRAFAELRQPNCPRRLPPTAGCRPVKRAARSAHPRQRRVQPALSPQPARRPTCLRSNRPFYPTDRAGRRPGSRRGQKNWRAVVRRAVQSSRSRYTKKGSFSKQTDEPLF